MYCRKCGKELDTNSNFCQHCGTPIDGAGNPSNPNLTTPPKKPKKPVYKRWWFWVLIALIALGSCVPKSEAPEETVPTTSPVAVETVGESTVTTTTETLAETSTATSATPSSEAAATFDIYTAAALVESFSKENFENYDISCEDDTITVNVWQDGIAAGAMLATAGNQEAKSAWDSLVENTQGYCESTSELVDSLGLDDVFVVVNILNDQNTENVLLSILEGTVIYDVTND